jgi:hypothetical protein
MDVREAGYRRAWARIAGLMYWLVFVFDFAGMTRGGTSVGHWLSLVGGLLTILLAYGLYAALAPVQRTVAMSALGFRIAEIVLTLMSVIAGFPAIRSAWAGSSFLRLAHWGNATGFAAFVFTIGSTLFFLLFFRSRMIPPALSVFGIFASLVAFAGCLAHLIRPAFQAMTMWVWIPMIPAELITGAWLAIRSVSYARVPARFGVV